MLFNKKIRIVLFATLFSLIFAVTEAKADLIIRATVFNSAGTQIDQEELTVLRSDPPPANSDITFSSNSLTNFVVVVATNIATTGDGSTEHSHTINVNYSGSTGSDSSKLVLEFIGVDYVSPTSPPQAFITSNASPSTSGLKADTVTMESGVSNTNAGLPGTVGDLSGFLGTTLGEGTMGNASSVLTPNPSIGDPFDISNQFSFYQVFTFDDFQSTGGGSISAGSTVTNLPVPPTLALLFAASPALAAGIWRKRRKAKAQLS